MSTCPLHPHLCPLRPHHCPLRPHWTAPSRIPPLPGTKMAAAPGGRFPPDSLSKDGGAAAHSQYGGAAELRLPSPSMAAGPAPAAAGRAGRRTRSAKGNMAALRALGRLRAPSGLRAAARLGPAPAR